MTFTSEVRKLAGTKPFYAVAGCGDLAVEKLREVPGRFQEVQGQLQSQLNDLPTGRADLQDRALSYAGSLATLATSTYEDLAKRGHGVVGRVRGQEATQELEAQAKTTSRQTKAATTSARKTASTAKKAAGDGAGQVG